MQGEEHIAAPCRCAASVYFHRRINVSSRGYDLKTAVLKRRLEFEVQFPDHGTFIIGLNDRALIIGAADVSGVQTNLDFTHCRHPLPRWREK